MSYSVVQCYFSMLNRNAFAFCLYFSNSGRIVWALHFLQSESQHVFNAWIELQSVWKSVKQWKWWVRLYIIAADCSFRITFLLSLTLVGIWFFHCKEKQLLQHTTRESDWLRILFRSCSSQMIVLFHYFTFCTQSSLFFLITICPSDLRAALDSHPVNSNSSSKVECGRWSLCSAILLVVRNCSSSKD